MQRILASLGMALFLSQAAYAEYITLITYSHLQGPDIMDVDPIGLSVGDMFTRHGTKHATPDGPEIGEYFSQATIVFVDPERKRSVRSYLVETVFNDGSIYMTDLVDVDHTRPIEAKHSHTGAVIGGTGSYSGARGTYTLEIEDGIGKKTIIYTVPD